MTQKPSDPVIDEVREIRQRISARFGHDPARLTAYYEQLQERHRDRLLDAPTAPARGRIRRLASTRRKQPLPPRPAYARVWLTFLRNSLVREMTFRGNFLITILTRAFYFAANLLLFEIIYRSVPSINGWSKWEYYAFMATGMLINALVETFFMPNCANFGELIRTGNLDFALLKPIDTQFLVSFEKVEVAMLGQVAFSLALLGLSVDELGLWPTFATGEGLARVLLYLLLLACGTAFFYSLMIVLAATSVWFGRNTGLYDFWFYVTVFARYPREIYSGPGFAAAFVQDAFTYVVPILLVVTVPSRVLVKAVESPAFVGLCVAAASGGLVVSRLVFTGSLRAYRSASS